MTRSPNSHRRAYAVLVFLAVLTMAWWASAQQGEKKRQRQLHEYFEVPRDFNVVGARPTGEQPKRPKARTPGAEPPLTLDNRSDEPVLGQNGPTSTLPLDNPQGGLNPLNAKNSLDNRTDKVDELNYFSSFDPSVIPYKRVVAQNALVLDGSKGYAFVVETGTKRRVEVSRDPARFQDDTFWGTFLVRAEPGKLLPIPSVAPSQRVLKVTSEPDVGITVLQDAADNFYVQTNHRGLVRLNIKLAVPRFYFNGDFSEVSWGDLDRSRVIELPARAKTASRRVLNHIGVSRSQRPRDAFTRLVQYYRSFEGKEFPDELLGQDLYESISKSKLGVCRHRSFAFSISASALGFPVRYVYNEAHAFVEVLWPRLGWRRVDLGGAAQDVLMRANDRQQRIHDAVDKSLPEPPSYLEEIERMANQPGSEHSGSGGSAGVGTDGPSSQDPDPSNPSSTGPSSTDTNPSDPTADPAAQENDTRIPVRITELRYSAQTVRGQPFKIAGRALADMTSGQTPLAMKKIQVTLGTGSGEGRSLGEATTSVNGAFELEVLIPADLPIGRWSIQLTFPGDDRHRPSQSD